MMHELFPTPVFEKNIGVPEGTLSILDTMEWDRFETKSITKEKNILNFLPSVYNLIQKQVEDWCYNTLLIKTTNELEIVRSWAASHKTRDSCDWHSHTNAVMSGVYYIMCNPDSGRLFFNKGAHYQNCFVPTLEPDTVGFVPATAKQFSILPEPGTLLMFPSQLVHRAERNQSTNWRLCIAYDVFIRGRIGTDHGNEVTL